MKHTKPNQVQNYSTSLYCDVTVSVGQEQHQPVETGVRHLRDVCGAPADGLNRGCSERLVLTLDVRLKQRTDVNSQKQTLDLSLKIKKKHTNLKLSQNSGDVGFIGEVGQDLQLHKNQVQDLFSVFTAAAVEQARVVKVNEILQNDVEKLFQSLLLHINLCKPA